MKLQTPVADDDCKVCISYDDKITMLGSCFSDNIGKQLKDFGFDVCVNPFGTLYNPISILRSVERLISRKEFTLEDCVRIGAGDDRFCSFSHHTSFARKEADEFVENANQALTAAADHFAKSTKVIITLGTSWCFRHESGKVVSNCLKRPAAEFMRERLSAGDTADCLRRIMEICQEAECNDGFASKEFIFTVSPIRHFKDGAHGNQISKAGLLLGIEEALPYGKSDYFPSYEIMMDELRDYRFYAEDMCHPTQQAVDYIRERFLNWALPINENVLLEENIKKHRRNCHIVK
jgi:hypothetical protein